MKYLSQQCMFYAFSWMLLLLCGCQLIPGRSAPALAGSEFVKDDRDGDGAVALFKEMGGEEAFLELAQYLYRWHLDENDLRNFNPEYRGKLWIRKINRVLDPGDNSSFLEIFLPAIGVTVNLKKTDYVIDELKLEVKSDGYKISSISRQISSSDVSPDEYAALSMNIDALYEHLFETRLDVEYPDEKLFEYLRKCVREQCGDYKGFTGEQIIWLAPVSPIANEIWVYWENNKMLFRFRSDVDMHNAEIWNHDSVRVSHYDIVKQTIVSHEEAPGEDDYVTRDQVGRVLFNCMALGRKVGIEKVTVIP